MGMFDFLQQPQQPQNPYMPFQGGTAPEAAGQMPAHRQALVNALSGGQQQAPQPMSSPWQTLGAGVNGAADGYAQRQADADQQQAMGQALAQQNGVQGPIQPAAAINDQNRLLTLPTFDVGSVFGNWGS